MWIQDMFLRWWLGGPRYTWSKIRRTLFERGFLKNPLPPVNTLADVQACLRKIIWKQDGFAELFDRVSYPHRVWSKKKDDCDGFAVLAAALLDQWDKKTNPVIVTAMVPSLAHCHSVCVFEMGGGLRYFSNSDLSPKIFTSYDKVIADFVNPAYRLVCWDVVEHDTLKKLEHHVEQ
jgi:hypothetical protein